MKRTYIILCTILLCMQCFAQNDSNSTATTVLKKGFYKSYQEYLDNNPSIIADFTTKLYRANKKDTTIIAGSYDLTTPNKDIKKPWGFCDGENVFIRYWSLTGNDYWKFQLPGPHPYILFKQKTIIASGAPLVALTSAAITTAIPAGFDAMVITKSGKVKHVGKKVMRSILADQPALLAEFKKEVKVMSNSFRIKYLKMYSEAVAGKK
ncbi:MAG TPA: hypothetical protein PKU77_15335 [Ferruginibacter sp.]|nr:hypothetical protein [Ferruginibacter sp.]